MNEPVLSKREPRPDNYKPITWGAFLKLKEAAQKSANAFGYPVYLVGSALHKEVPRDIDISIILPLSEFEELFGNLPTEQKDYGWYLAHTIRKSCNQCNEIISLQFCIEYNLDIKVCPDTWWTDKPKFLLAEPEKYLEVQEPQNPIWKEKMLSNFMKKE